MSREHEDDFLTESDIALIEALTQFDSVKSAAQSLGISYSTARQMLYRIRAKRVRAINTVNRLIAYSKRGKKLHDLLTPIVHLAPQLEVEVGAQNKN